MKNFNALELLEEPKALKLFLIFFKDHRCQMALKSKNVAFSSGTVIATTPMDGVPSQEGPISGKKLLSHY